MENTGRSKPKVEQESGNNIFERFKQVQEETRDRSGAIEYFLTKLKRADVEILARSAELREVNEEISRKDSKIEKLKMKLENLMREETNREIKRLEQMKNKLKGNIKKADRVLAGLGLIWVGEQATRINPDAGVRFIAHPEGSYYRPDSAHHELNNEPSHVTPFTGHGYRLGTGSEVFEQQGNESDVERSSPTQDSHPSSSRQSEADPKTAGSITKNSSGFELSRTSSDNRIRQVDAQRQTKIKSLEELPLEFQLMSNSERRRALKQVSVQIQKNMNKYTT